MLKFTAGYADTLNNFVIGQLDRYPLKAEDPNYPVFCVVKNILTRGSKIRLSEYLKQQLFVRSSVAAPGRYVPLLSTSVPTWSTTILGNNETNFNPARDFYYHVIPEYLGNAKGLQQLILPEALISDIIPDNIFVDQRVDFYLPQARLVIEIDGSQHKNAVNNIHDQQRDDEFQISGIDTVRISAAALQKRDNEFEIAMNKIKRRINYYWTGMIKTDSSNIITHDNSLVTPLSAYSQMTPLQYENSENHSILIQTSIMRFQIFLLSLMQRGLFDLSSNEITVCLYANDLNNPTAFQEALRLALEDVRIWISKVQSLLKIKHHFPQVQIVTCESNDDFAKSDASINVDLSLLKRWDETVDIKCSYFQIRTDYYESDVDYYQINCSDPLIYHLNIDEESPRNDISTLEFFIRNLFCDDQITGFREGQLPIIANILSRNDTIGILPTGVGKSLCYQLAALLQAGMSIIISPLKSLMLDQKRSVNQKLCMNHVDFINSTQTAPEKKRLQKDLALGKYHFVWVTPERFQTPAFRNCLIKANISSKISYAVIDEVHCMSEWGHDFRTSYLTLVKTIRANFHNPCILGLTATASSFVYKDLLNEFGITPENVKTPSSFDRKELSFHVLTTTNEMSVDKLLEKLLNEKAAANMLKPNSLDSKYHDGGLIFTQIKNKSMFRKGCQVLAPLISAKYNLQVFSYSASDRSDYSEISIDDARNAEIQKLFQENRIPLLVATKAFGMGIDKPNIRYVIHYGIPGSLDSLYQEAGRAGRDKNPAECSILYTPDNLTQEQRNVLFGLDSTRDQINEISNSLSGSCDLSTTLYFFLNNNKGMDFDLKVMKIIVSKYIKCGTATIAASSLISEFIEFEKDTNDVSQSDSKRIQIEKSLQPFSNLQKAVYRLSLLGLISDWTVEKWGEKTGVISICSTALNLLAMRDSLTAYIRKYEPDFELDKYIQSLVNKNIIVYSNTEVDQIMIALLKWTEENILYNRRMGIKNIIELCESYTDSISFRKNLEGYFRISEVQYKLNFIADNSAQCGYWFEPFYTSNEKHEIVPESLDNLKILKTSLQRMLENYRYHTGLNLVSGLNMFLLGDFENPDGRTRLLSALERIKTYDEKRRKLIFKDIMNLIYCHKMHLTTNAISVMSEILCSFYPAYYYWTKIYENFQDETSLTNILSYEVNRITEIGRN